METEEQCELCDGAGETVFYKGSEEYVFPCPECSPESFDECTPCPWCGHPETEPWFLAILKSDGEE